MSVLGVASTTVGAECCLAVTLMLRDCYGLAPSPSLTLPRRLGERTFEAISHGGLSAHAATDEKRGRTPGAWPAGHSGFPLSRE